MLQLIQRIDMAWLSQEAIFNINPNKCNGYFDFRNKVILKYDKIYQIL